MSTTTKRKSAFVVSMAEEGDAIWVPQWVTNLHSFRRWAWSDEFPQHGRVDYLDGNVWVDPSMEEFLTHNQIKTAFYAVLIPLILEGRMGRFVPDRMRITHLRARLSAEPDGAYASWNTLRSKRLRMRKGARKGYMELRGTPDMILEAISDSSVQKDTQVLMGLYWKAGIPEFWLVDARQDPPRFDIFKHTARGYVAVKKQKGWLRSAVFGKEFQLVRGADPLGDPQFTVNVR